MLRIAAFARGGLGPASPESLSDPATIMPAGKAIAAPRSSARPNLAKPLVRTVHPSTGTVRPEGARVNPLGTGAPGWTASRYRDGGGAAHGRLCYDRRELRRDRFIGND
jgi:hypothetical protein